MNYRAKRNAYGLSIYTISSRLGIDYKSYLEVEKGLKNLDGDRLNKFQEILKNSHIIKLERAKKMSKVNKWFEDGLFNEYLQKLNYNQRTLAKMLGCSQPHLSNVVNGTSKSPDLLERIYDFLTDSLNANISKEKKEKSVNAKDSIQAKKEIVISVDRVNINTDDYLKKENQELHEEVQFYKNIIETMCYLKGNK